MNDAEFQLLDHAITLTDTQYLRPRFAGSYLLEGRQGAAFIETGTTPGIPRLLATLQARGIAPDTVRYVVVTHVHLDHAGGGGAWRGALPAVGGGGPGGGGGGGGGPCWSICRRHGWWCIPGARPIWRIPSG